MILFDHPLISETRAVPVRERGGFGSSSQPATMLTR